MSLDRVLAVGKNVALMELTYSVFHCVVYFYDRMSRDTYARVLCFLAMTAWLFLPSSRQTQWDPPTWESPGDDASLEHISGA